MRLGTKFIELFYQIGEFQHRSLKPFLPSQLTLSPFKHEQFASATKRKSSRGESISFFCMSRTPSRI
jgi:hypothetical protein